MAGLLARIQMRNLAITIQMLIGTAALQARKASIRIPGRIAAAPILTGTPWWTLTS
jgi:hypothetical protein